GSRAAPALCAVSRGRCLSWPKATGARPSASTLSALSALRCCSPSSGTSPFDPVCGPPAWPHSPSTASAAPLPEKRLGAPLDEGPADRARAGGKERRNRAAPFPLLVYGVVAQIEQPTRREPHRIGDPLASQA